MQEPKNQMLGTMEPPLMQLSVKTLNYSKIFNILSNNYLRGQIISPAFCRCVQNFMNRNKPIILKEPQIVLDIFNANKLILCCPRKNGCRGNRQPYLKIAPRA